MTKMPRIASRAGISYIRNMQAINPEIADTGEIRDVMES